MGQERKPGYWAVIPADVRYDPELPPNAKLLYAEISALCDSKGYCFAGNAYFAELYGLSIPTVQRLLRALAKRGYIRVDILRDKLTNAVEERRIYAGINPAGNAPPPRVKNDMTPEQKQHDPSCQKCDSHKEEQLSEGLNNTPYSPPRGAAVPKYKPEWFERFYAKYPRHTAREKAVRAWDKLRPDRRLCRTMSAALDVQIRSAQWQDQTKIPHPSTWLNGRRWEDEVPVPSSGAPPDDDGIVEERRLPTWT